jgi:hypothetical protein
VVECLNTYEINLKNETACNETENRKPKNEKRTKSELRKHTLSTVFRAKGYQQRCADWFLDWTLRMPMPPGRE